MLRHLPMRGTKQVYQVAELPGAEYTLTIFQQQHQICKSPSFPHIFFMRMNHSWNLGPLLPLSLQSEQGVVLSEQSMKIEALLRPLYTALTKVQKEGRQHD